MDLVHKYNNPVKSEQRRIGFIEPMLKVHRGHIASDAKVVILADEIHRDPHSEYDELLNVGFSPSQIVAVCHRAEAVQHNNEAAPGSIHIHGDVGHSEELRRVFEDHPIAGTGLDFCKSMVNPAVRRATKGYISMCNAAGQHPFIHFNLWTRGRGAEVDNDNALARIMDSTVWQRLHESPTYRSESDRARPTFKGFNYV